MFTARQFVPFFFLPRAIEIEIVRLMSKVDQVIGATNDKTKHTCFSAWVSGVDCGVS
jgi:hypothetical protein